MPQKHMVINAESDADQVIIIARTAHRMMEIGMKVKKQLVKSLVWSIALYGSESLAVKKCDENGARRLNCGPGDVCCVSARLNIRLTSGVTRLQ